MNEDSEKIERILKKAQDYKAKKEQEGRKKRPITTGGFWVSPTGEVRRTHRGLYHIADIIGNPEEFGLTKDDIEREHALHGEQIGQEGAARDSLMTKALKRGWIRIRARRNFFSAQVWDFNIGTYENLERFVEVATEDGIDGEYGNDNDEIKVNSLKTGKMKSLTFGEIKRGHLYEAEETRLDHFYFNR